MKVISAPEFQLFRITCKCEAVLEIDKPDDLVRCEGFDYRESWCYLQATCPCCGTVITIDKDRVPVAIRLKLRNISA